MKRTAVILASAAALVGLCGSARAQSAAPRFSAPHPQGYFDYFVSRYDLRQPARTSLEGFGARVMLPLAPSRADGVLGRAWLGGYAAHAPEERGMEMWRFGAQADVALAPAPLAGWVAPFVSLGVGGVRVEERAWSSPPALPDRPLFDLRPGFSPGPRVETALSVTPGVGARVFLLPGVGFRTDLRRVIDLRSRVRASTELSGGLTLPL